MCKKLDLLTYKKGQVWLMKDSWTHDERDMQITIGDRPVLVINNVNVRGKFVTVIPFSASESQKSGVCVNLELNKLSTALVHEIRPVPASSLTNFLGCLTERVMDEIDLALKIYLGLENNLEMEAKYFKYSTDKIISISEKTSPPETINKPTPKKEDSITTVSSDKKPRLNINTLSDDDKKFIIDSDIQQIAKKFNIAVSTAYRWKRILKNESETSNKDEIENKEPESKPFKIVSTNKYGTKVYSKFAAKKLINLSLNDKKLFTKLDSCKLSTTMNIPLQQICTAQAQFMNEISKRK